MSNYIEIQETSGVSNESVRQDLKFRTGKFVWRVSFTAPLNPTTVNSTNLYVTDTAGKQLRTSIRYDSVTNCIEIDPLEPYAQNTSYILNITKNVESKGGQKLKNEVKLTFKV